jgi:hypothetical protein
MEIEDFKLAGSYRFDKMNEDVITTKIRHNVNLRIEYSIDGGHLYFVDDENKEIKIPVGLEVFNHNLNKDIAPFTTTPFYNLNVDNSYTIKIQDDVILRLRSEKSWMLSRPRRCGHLPPVVKIDKNIKLNDYLKKLSLDD